jgi:hypothetical protein
MRNDQGPGAARPISGRGAVSTPEVDSGPRYEKQRGIAGGERPRHNCNGMIHQVATDLEFRWEYATPCGARARWFRATSTRPSGISIASCAASTNVYGT